MRRFLRWLLIQRLGALQSASLSLRGAFFLFGTTLIGLASIDAGINLLLMVFGLCLGAVLLSGFVGWRPLRRIHVQRVAPDGVTAGQPFEIRYSVRNHSRWGAVRNLHLSDSVERGAVMSTPEAYVPVLRAGETLIVTVPLAARSRGRVKLSGVRCTTTFPFGIFAKSVTIRVEHEIVVFPKLCRLIGDIRPPTRAADTAHTGGVPAAVKGDEEFYGVREYRAGDNPRRIHWRQSARTGQLMVREMTKTRDHKYWCVLSTRINPKDPLDLQRLESAISAAATAVCDALEKGIRVGLICDGEPLVVLPPGGGRAHRPRLLRELALRARNTHDDLAPHIDRLTWPNRWRGGCLLFAPRETDDVRAASRALQRVIGPTTICLPGTPAFESLFVQAEWIPARAPLRRERAEALL